MSIALYNLAVEHEYQNEYFNALTTFSRALNIVNTKLGSEGASMHKVISEGIESVKKKQINKVLPSGQHTKLQEFVSKT